MKLEKEPFFELLVHLAAAEEIIVHFEQHRDPPVPSAGVVAPESVLALLDPYTSLHFGRAPRAVHRSLSPISNIHCE